MKTIEDLKKECENKFGRSLRSPSDFDAFSSAVTAKTHRSISVSTLKRIWGYVAYPNKPSYEIRSILAAFCGYNNWQSFAQSDQISDISDFLSKDVIKSDTLELDDMLTLKWEPNRICEIRYLGDSRFEVVRSENSKLLKGDTFSTSVIAGNEPLVCNDIRRGGELLASMYIAGKTGGIRIIE